MVSKDFSKQDFIVNVFRRDLSNLTKAQRLIAEKNVYVTGKSLNTKQKKGAKIGKRTGSLLRSLEHPNYQIKSGANGNFTVVSSIVTHLRFIDMKKRGNRQIYNRQMYGILYRNTLPTLRYDFTRGITDNLGQALDEAFKNK